MNNDLILKGVGHLRKYKEKLADEFDHYFCMTVKDTNNGFLTLNYIIDEEGRIIKILSVDTPKDVMSCLYPTEINFGDEFIEEYKNKAKEYEIAVNPEIFGVIVQSPFKLTALETEGDEKLIKKIIFKERLRGDKYLALSEKIKKDQKDFVCRNYKKETDGIYYFFYLNKMHVAFFIPEKYNFDEKSILVASAKIYKEKLISRYPELESSYKIPSMNFKNHSYCVLKTDIENIGNFDFESIYSEMKNFMEKLIIFIDKNA
ncbi:MAG TPA: DUF4895 domain-containing protein [Tepiditoga sp.]|nr:DUF4895 domain-containing protein [Thermotogota bacterium]HOO74859.1 DUF4895 domain-containing protein [Tepiditoga sp.]